MSLQPPQSTFCRRLVWLAAGLVWAGGAQGVLAQQLGNPGRFSGKLIRVGGDWIEIATADQAKLRVVVSQAQLDLAAGPSRDPASRKTLRLSVEGAAAPEVLAKGQHVSFSAMLSEKHLSQADVREVTIVTPDDSKAPGLTLADAAPGDGPPGGAANYLVVGQIKSFRSGQLTVGVPAERDKQLSLKVKLADDAQVRLAVADLAFARPGSDVEATGYTLLQQGRPVPDVALGEVVQIRLIEPVAGRKTAGAKPARPERTSVDAAAEQPLRARRDLPAEDQTADDSPPSPAGPGGGLVQPGDPPPAELIVKDDKFTVDGPVARQSSQQNADAADE